MSGNLPYKGADLDKLREIAGALTDFSEFTLSLIGETTAASSTTADTMATSAIHAIVSVWKSAPIPAKIRFVLDLLPEDSPLLPALREARSLEELRLRGDELMAWIKRYPALFADSVQVMRDQMSLISTLRMEVSSINLLASELIVMVGMQIDLKLESAGGAWLEPKPGEQINSNHEVTADNSSAAPVGTVARTLRNGLKWDGKLVLPALVVRSTGQTVEPSTNVTTDSPMAIVCTELAVIDPDVPMEVPHITPSGVQPDWLRALLQPTSGSDLPALVRIVRAAAELASLTEVYDRCETLEQLESSLLGPLSILRPILGMRYPDGLESVPAVPWGEALLAVRDPLKLWLSERLQLECTSPQRGDPFNAGTMRAVDTRKTVHAPEIDTVARLEAIGLKSVRFGGMVVLADVIRYTAGGES